MLKRIFVAGLLASAVSVSAPVSAGSNTAEHIAAELILQGLLGVRHDHYSPRHDRIARAEQRRYRERLLRQERRHARQEREYRRRIHASREHRHARRDHWESRHDSHGNFRRSRHDEHRGGRQGRHYDGGRESRRDRRSDVVRVETHVGSRDREPTRGQGRNQK